MNAAALPDKWFEGLDAASPVPDAAQHVLESRMSAVARMARSVVKAHAQDDEAVHQLRVATRRAEAALLAFKPWMREGHRKLARKILKDLRKAAGEVRAIDVDCLLVRAELPAAETDVRGAMEHSLLLWDSHRTIALRDLLDAARQARRRLDRLGSRWVRRFDAQPRDGEVVPDLRTAGDTALRALAADYLALADENLAMRENLHRLRVQGKRLRYAIEIFGPTASAPDALAGLSESLIALQDRLGAVNDFHDVAARLAQDAAAADRIITGDHQSQPPSSTSRHIECLADVFEQHCVDASRSFLEWWESDASASFRDAMTALAQPPETTVAAEPPEVVVVATNNGVAKQGAAALTEAHEDQALE